MASARGGAARRDRGDDEDAELRAIQDVADELGVTTRTLRYYEAKGLLEPRRVGTMRVYTRRELGRLQLILRGKRLGFSIREIGEFLDLYDADPQHIEQMRKLAERTAERVAELEQQKLALEETLGELREIVSQANAHVARIEAVAGKG